MGSQFGTTEWAESLRDEINRSSEYRNAAADWGVGWNGDVLLTFEADATFPETRSLYLSLAGGECREARFVSGTSGPGEIGFALRAPFKLWRDILERKTLAATAILTGRLRVEGDKSKLLKYLAAHRALIHCTASLDTVFS